MKIPLAPYLLLALAMVGLADTLYLSYFQYYNVLPTCQIGGCTTVLTSEYSKFFSVPWSYIGLMYYVYMFCLAFLLAVDPYSKGLRLGVLIYTGIGFLYSVYAIAYVQITLLQAICQYCAISALVTVGLFAVGVWHFRAAR